MAVDGTRSEKPAVIWFAGRLQTLLDAIVFRATAIRGHVTGYGRSAGQVTLWPGQPRHAPQTEQQRRYSKFFAGDAELLHHGVEGGTVQSETGGGRGDHTVALAEHFDNMIPLDLLEGGSARQFRRGLPYFA